MKLIYKPQKDKKGETKIFGYSFVNKNKKALKMIIDNKMKNLEEKIIFDDIKKPMIKLIKLRNIYDLSYMFHECASLLKISNSSKYIKIFSKENYINKILERKSKIIILKNNNSRAFNKNIFYQSFIFHKNLPLFPLQDILEFNSNQLTNIKSKFCVNSSLKLLPNISEWKTKNIYNMKYLFCGCSSLKSLPDISKWNTNNVKNMDYMFYGCSSLISLPDISKWNTYNVKNMDYMFGGCSLLKSLPDISKWNTKNLVSKNNILGKCPSLKNKAYIYKSSFFEKSKMIYKTSNIIKMFGKSFLERYKNSFLIMYKGKIMKVKDPYIRIKNIDNKTEIYMIPLGEIPDKSEMFKDCKSLEEFTLSYRPLPDKSQILRNNINNMRAMFSMCSALKSLPDISEWNTENVTDMSYMFYHTKSIITLPDISNWKTNKLINMDLIFTGCSSLISLPDISKWNINNVINMDLIFGGCSSLISLPDISKWNTSNVLSMDGCFKVVHL